MEPRFPANEITRNQNIKFLSASKKKQRYEQNPCRETKSSEKNLNLKNEHKLEDHTEYRRRLQLAMHFYG